MSHRPSRTIHLWRRRPAGGCTGETPVPQVHHKPLARHLTTLRRATFATIVLLAGGWGPGAGSLSAADADRSQGTQHRSAGAALADRESIIRDRVSRLEDRMFQLGQALRKGEPDKAQRLMDGLGALRGARVRERVERIVEKLRSEEYADAVDAQREVAAELQSLLKLLLEDSDNLEERKEELNRLDAFGKALEKIIREQEKELSDARAAMNAEQRAAALTAAAKKLEKLIKQQKDVAGSGNPAQASLRQAKIRGETDSVSKAVKSVAEAPKSSDDADLPKVADKIKKAQGALDQATKKMRSAQIRLQEQGGSGAKAAQEGAAEDLERARKDLSEAARELRQERELQKQAESQEKTAAKTDQLHRKMKKGSQDGGESGPSGEGKQSEGQQKDGKSGSQGSDKDAEPTPGQESVEEAVPLQQDAAKELKKDKPAEAAKKQQKALEKLKNAKEELEDRLEQLRREQQEELLAALESRFRAMLSRQLECNKATNRLAEVGADHWKRSDQLELAELSQRQKWVGDQADEALFLLVEEGTTVILPKLIGQVRDDGRAAAERLAAADTGPTVRMMQTELEQVLRDIIDAVKKEQEELEKSGGAGGSGGQGSPPLLPGSAELKLLRACQLRVNAATERLETVRSAGQGAAQEIEKRLKRLAARQADVAAMAKDMHEAMTRAQ